MKKNRLVIAAAAMAMAGTGTVATIAPAAASMSVSVPEAQIPAAPVPAPAPAPAPSTETAVSTQGVSTQSVSTQSVSEDSAPAADSSFSSQVSEAVLERMNDVRTEQGLPALEGSSDLDAMSAGWSGQMAASSAATHNPSFIDQTLATGSTAMAENIAYSVGSQGSVEETADYFVDFWLNSPSHNANIMNPEFTAAGFGLAEGSDGNIYGTQNFGAY